MKLHFVNYKEELFERLFAGEYEDKLLEFIHQLKSEGFSKKEIYELFLDFMREVHLDSRTCPDEEMYDRLANFMDGFTAWGKFFKILPDEPDL